jgi:hypothetical protein
MSTLEKERPGDVEGVLLDAWRPVKSRGTSHWLGPAFAPRLLSQLRMFTPAGVTSPSS